MAISKINTRALANDSVTTDKVADNAITTDMVASGEIGVTDLADGSITNAKVSTTAAIAPSKIDMASVAALTMSGHLSGDTATFTGDVAINNGSPELYFGTTGVHYNWMLAAQENLDQAFEISVGSQDTDYSNDTYSTVVTVKADGNMDLVTGGLKVGGTTVIDSSRNATLAKINTTKIGDGDAGVLFNSHGGGNLDAILPFDFGNDSLYNGHVDIGGASNKFKDLHMSGVADVGSVEVGGTTVINSSQVGFLNEKTRIGTGATYPTDNAQLYIQRSNNNPYIGFFSNDGSRNAYLQSNGSGAFYLNNAEGGGWAFNNSTSDVLSITNTGAILGTDKLQITPGGTNYGGGSNTFASGAAVEIYAETLNTSSLLIANNSGNAHTWFNYTNGNNYITGDASNNTGDTIFRTYTANPDNYSENVFFKANGNVGINTDNPVTLENRTTLQVSGNIKLGSANAEGLISIGDVNSTSANVGIWRGNSNSYGSNGNYLGLGGYSGITFTTGNSGISSQSRRMMVRGDGDIELMNLQSAVGGIDTNALYWKIQNSGNTGQFSRLGGIKAETVSNWGGKLKFYTKPANGSPNDTVTERMVIDQAGRVTTPNVPAFLAFLSNGSENSTTVIVFNNVYHNNGGHYSNSTGVFTAPVDGYYHFTVGAIVGGAPVDGTQRNGELQLQKNGTHYTRGHWNHADRWENVSYTQVIYLSANDQARVYFVNNTNNNEVHGNSLYTHFGGHLIG